LPLIFRAELPNSRRLPREISLYLDASRRKGCRRRRPRLRSPGDSLCFTRLRNSRRKFPPARAARAERKKRLNRHARVVADGANPPPHTDATLEREGLSTKRRKDSRLVHASSDHIRQEYPLSPSGFRSATNIARNTVTAANISRETSRHRSLPREISL